MFLSASTHFLFENSAKDRPGLRRPTTTCLGVGTGCSSGRGIVLTQRLGAINEGITVAESSTGWENEAM